MGWKTSSSSLIEGKGMECLISLKLLKEHDPPLQDTYVYRYVHVHIEKHRDTHKIDCMKSVSICQDRVQITHKPNLLSKTSREISFVLHISIGSASSDSDRKGFISCQILICKELLSVSLF